MTFCLLSFMSVSSYFSCKSSAETSSAEQANVLTRASPHQALERSISLTASFLSLHYTVLRPQTWRTATELPQEGKVVNSLLARDKAALMVAIRPR